MATTLIDRDYALLQLRMGELENGGVFETDSAHIKEFLNALPNVDAVEVVHGRWEPVDHDGSWRVDMCSICYRRMHYVDYDQPYQYCPNCGARMDGGKE